MSEWAFQLGAVDEVQASPSALPPPEPNPNPVVTSDMLPGFRLSRSIFASRTLVDETWVKDPAPGQTDHTFVKLTLYRLEDRAAALAAARSIYFATTNNYYDTADAPRFGSYSGRPVGDYCWAYKRSLAPGEGQQYSSALIVIRGSDLYCLSVSCVAGGISDSQSESVARAVAQRLETWPGAPVARLDPAIVYKRPAPGQKTGPRPRVKARVTVGDQRYPQADVHGIVFKVDGKNRTHELERKVKLRRNPQEGKPYQKVKLTWRPAKPLANGEHSVELYVPTLGYSGSGPGATTARVTFWVNNRNDDPADECDEDDDDENDWNE